jgi:hypothetical protein
MRMNKHKTFEIMNYLARDAAKAPPLNMHDDAIQQGAGLSPTDAAATQSEVRSGPITSDYYSVLAGKWPHLLPIDDESASGGREVAHLPGPRRR